MNLEYIVLLFVFLFVCFYKFNDKETSFIFYTLSLILILFSSLRYDVGIDYLFYFELVSNYSSFYSTSLKHIYEFEPIHQILIKFLYFLFSDRYIVFYIYICIMSVITVSCYVIFILHNTNDKYLSLFIFMTLPIFYLSSLNAVRMFAASSVFLVSLVCIEKNNIFKYLLFCTICISLHKISFILLPLYFILKIRFSLFKYLLVLCITIFFPFYEIIITNLVKIFNLPLFYILEYDNEFNKLSVIFFLISLVLIIYFKLKLNVNKAHNILLNMLFLSQVLIIISFHLPFRNDYIFRLTGFFLPALIILLPLFVSLIKIKQKFIMRKLLICICLAYFLITINFRGNEYNLVPYKSILYSYN